MPRPRQAHIGSNMYENEVSSTYRGMGFRMVGLAQNVFWIFGFSLNYGRIFRFFIMFRRHSFVPAWSGFVVHKVVYMTYFFWPAELFAG